MSVYEFLRIVEIRTKIVSVSTFSLAVTWALFRGSVVDPVILIILGLSALSIDMGTTAFNTFYDYLHGVDRKEFNKEADKVLVHNEVPPGYALLVALGLFALGSILGIVLIFLKGLWLLPAGMICMAIGFLYNGGPLPISRTPLGEIFAGGALGGGFFVIAVAVLGAPVDSLTLFAGIPSTLIIAAILTTNNTCDMVGDKAAGRLTLSLLIGKKWAILLHHGLVLCAFLGAISLAVVVKGVSSSALLAASPVIVAGVLVVPQLNTMAKAGFSHDTKGPNMGRISKIFLIYTLSFVAEIVLFNLK